MSEEGDSGPLGALLGTSLGSFIGLLGGLPGVAIGAIAGSVAGMASDLDNARVGTDFADEVSRQLTPGKTALVAEIEEEWTTAIDQRMEKLGGVVYRRALSEAMDSANSEDVAAMKADVAQMKAEHAQAHPDWKAKLQEKINQLDSKIQAQLQKAKERREATERQANPKVEVLKAKARPQEPRPRNAAGSSARVKLSGMRLRPVHVKTDISRLWRESRFEEGVMNVQGQHKCEYPQCKCVVGGQEKYCSDYCSDADDQHEDELQCDCKHAPCALD